MISAMWPLPVLGYLADARSKLSRRRNIKYILDVLSHFSHKGENVILLGKSAFAVLFKFDVE